MSEQTYDCEDAALFHAAKRMDELKTYIKRLEEYIHENMCIVLPQYDNCVCVDCRDARNVLATRPEGLE